MNLAPSRDRTSAVAMATTLVPDHWHRHRTSVTTAIAANALPTRGVGWEATDGIPYPVESRILPDGNSGFLLGPDIPSMLYHIGKLTGGGMSARNRTKHLVALTSLPLEQPSYRLAILSIG